MKKRAVGTQLSSAPRYWSFSGDVIPQCNVALCFFRRRFEFDQKSRLQTAAATSCLASPFFGEMVRSYCTMLLPEFFFLCNSNVKRLYTVYQQFSYQSTAITQTQNLRRTHLRWSDNMA